MTTIRRVGQQSVFISIGVAKEEQSDLGSKNIFKLSKMGSEVDCSGVSRAVWLVKVKQLF